MKKRRKWLLLGIALFLLLLFGLSQFYAYIMKDQWNERSKAEEVAMNQAGLTDITEAKKSVWDENAIYWVVTGQNGAGTEMMVWVRFTTEGEPAGGVNDIYAAEVAGGTSEEQIRTALAAELPGVEIKRLLPGVYNGEYAWQVFYRDKERYYYKFYRFADGAAIGEGYSLPNS
ncbi:hypothetical protein C2I18_01650 [Paenibacillus sp. PK3_47]|uniref:cell wall elongation regulator TseB-like domain-containing protein n=1 Tax=Paenibacillus sp. PK3_47 TaxID=2072642 RepID=UPI00201DD406|nr:DUF5590 domain-containing protein [Paenibacillus sp. PK3_47]UQZ32367.1 hypothetical protein C2I18_01650 [Paenibacillus sp. PK3_47]